jgi:hypothetical protein
MGLTNSFWYRGYGPGEPQTVIVAGFEREQADRLFQTCEVAARNPKPFGVENEESRDHQEILVCRTPRMPWSVLWKRYRRFG